MQSVWYRRIFPATVLQRVSEQEPTITAGGSRLATLLGGTLTRRGADIMSSALVADLRCEGIASTGVSAGTTASAFLVALIKAALYRIRTVPTDNGIQFRYPPRYAEGRPRST